MRQVGVRQAGVERADLKRTFREMRNITSHTYDEAKALQVSAGVPAFLEEVRVLLGRMQARSGS